VEAPNATGLKTLWIKKQSNTIKRKSMTINNHRGTSGYILGDSWLVLRNVFVLILGLSCL
jgi:hypothetical protein